LKAALEEARVGYLEGERVAQKMVEAAQEKLEWWVPFLS
jgi:hypothetical protein